MKKTSIIRQISNPEFYYLAKGNRVWVENIGTKKYDDIKEEPYFLGTIIRNDENRKEIEVSYISNTKGNEVVKYDRTMSYVNPPNINVNDMAAVEDINEIDLLCNLKNRFNYKTIFTNVGTTLIIINPYQNIPGVFGDEIIEKFELIQKEKNMDEKTEVEQPHLYDLTLTAIKNLILNRKNQAIVISGESGAGKTETAKQAMKCITQYFSKFSQSPNVTSSNPVNDQKCLLENKILGCNPILEAFGNAKTLRNDNSSRFGKYVTIHIDLDKNKIEGGQIETYLLEKSRICEPAIGERNYHIFYHLLKGLDDNLLSQLNLTRDPADYKYLARSKCFTVDTIEDAEFYKEVLKALQVTGFTEQEILTIHKILATCLLLGNCEFKEEDGDVFVSDTASFEKICNLLGCTNESLDRALTQNVKVIKNEVISKPLKISECLTYRNIFAKELYNRLFSWIVKKLNKSLSPGLDSTNKNKTYIGLLDIFGFECFENNSLEQLCINYTNEKLQQLFINDVFKAETIEFVREGLQEHISKINFKDNQLLIDLLDKNNGGLFQLLDDVSLTSQNDNVYFESMKKFHANNSLCKIKNRPKFFIFHTAKEVEYNIEGFIEKNLDEVKSTMTEVALNSKNYILRYIFFNAIDEEEFQKLRQNLETEKSAKVNKKELKFLVSKFRNEMAHLMNELISCQCNYIRCLKPNEAKKREFLVPTLIFKQIKYLGILDSIRIRKKGYPCRQKFKEFFNRFEKVCWYNEKINIQQIILKFQDDHDYKDLAVKCLNYMSSKRKNEECLVGKTKIFMKNHFYSNLEKFRKNREKLLIKSSIMIGKIYRGYKVRKQIKLEKRNIAYIQQFFQKKKFFFRMKKKRKAVIKIQATYRSFVCCRAHRYKLVCIYKLQNYIKGYLIRKVVKKKIVAGKYLNRFLKMCYMKLHYAKMREMKKMVYNLLDMAIEYYLGKREFFAALMVQSNMRRYLARQNHADKILRGQLKRIQFLQKRSVIIIQKIYRGYLLRKWLIQAFHSAMLIQNYWRITRYLFLISEMRKAVKKIQKGVITFLTRKHIINSRCKEYFKKEKKELDRLILDTSINLFPNFVKINEITNEGDVKYTQYFDTFSSAVEAEDLNTTWVPPYDPFAEKKINLFAKVVDIDIIVDSNETYNQNWAEELHKVCKMNFMSKAPIQLIHIGSSHTITINAKGRIYSWGWNNYGQCGHSIYSTFENVFIPNFNRDKNGEFPFLPALNYLNSGKSTSIAELTNIKQVSCGDDVSFMVDDNGNAYAFGENEKGQLGLGHTFQVQKPSLITELQGKVKEIKTTGEINIAITNDNGFYLWPFENFKQSYKPLRLFLDKKITVSTISCGKNFALLLSKQGIIYSFGKSNKSGELGLGDFKSRIMPELIYTLAETGEKITQISCGYKHCIAKSSLGKVFTWGNNIFGQLGIGNNKNNPFPTMINFDAIYPTKIKIIQVAAGFRSSFFLTDSRQINYCGTNGDINKVNTPVKMELGLKNIEVADENLFSVVRILTTWNKSFSIFYCTFADIRMIQEKIKNKQKIFSILNTLATKWESDTVYPPFIEGIAGYFYSHFIKKPKEDKKNKF